MLEYGAELSQFDIIPFPIEYPEQIYNYAPSDAKFYVTIYDAWGEKKLSILKDLGLSTEVMWIKTNADRITSGTEIRQLIRDDLEWKHLVPKAVYRYIIENNLDKLIKES